MRVEGGVELFERLLVVIDTPVLVRFPCRYGATSPAYQNLAKTKKHYTHYTQYPTLHLALDSWAFSTVCSWQLTADSWQLIVLRFCGSAVFAVVAVLAVFADLQVLHGSAFLMFLHFFASFLFSFFQTTLVCCGSPASVHGHKPACPHRVSASPSTPLRMLLSGSSLQAPSCERAANSWLSLQEQSRRCRLKLWNSTHRTSDRIRPSARVRRLLSSGRLRHEKAQHDLSSVSVLAGRVSDTLFLPFFYPGPFFTLAFCLPFALCPLPVPMHCFSLPLFFHFSSTIIHFSTFHFPFTIHHSPFIIHHSPFTIYRLLSTIYHLPTTIKHSTCTIYNLHFSKKKKSLFNVFLHFLHFYFHFCFFALLNNFYSFTFLHFTCFSHFLHFSFLHLKKFSFLTLFSF